MAFEKRYTAKQAAEAVLNKARELLASSELAKAETKHARCVEHVKENSPEVKNPHAVCVAEGVKPGNWTKSEQPRGEIHPKEKEQAPSDDVRHQAAPGANPAEQKEGNNELAGTTPTQVGQDGKNVPGFDEMRGHIKLAKFIGHMESKRKTRMGV